MLGVTKLWLMFSWQPLHTRLLGGDTEQFIQSLHTGRLLHGSTTSGNSCINMHCTLCPGLQEVWGSRALQR
jgi:hypothetical protein